MQRQSHSNIENFFKLPIPEYVNIPSQASDHLRVYPKNAPCLQNTIKSKRHSSLANLGPDLNLSPIKQSRKASIMSFIPFIRKNTFQSTKQKKKFNYILLIMLLQKFVKNLKYLIVSKKLDGVNKSHFVALDDNSCYSGKYEDLRNMVLFRKMWESKIMVKKTGHLYYIYYSIKSVLDIVKKRLTEIGEKVPIFDGSHGYRLLWDSFMLFFLILNVINVPISLSFSLEPDNYNSIIYLLVEELPGIFLVLDILINMNTSYYSKGYFVRNRHKILKKYMKENFLLDLITILPFIIGNIIKNINFVEMAFLMRVVKLKQISKKLEDFLLLREKAMAIVNLIKLAFFLLFIANICGCIFHFVAVVEKNFGIDVTWLDTTGIAGDPWYIRFVFSLYWAIVTMITVGYGDIAPHTVVEKMIAIVIIIFSCGVFGYSINAIGTIIQNLSIKETEFYKKISSFSYFMQSRKISRELQSEIKRYLEYTKNEEITYSQKISSAFSSSLSIRLKKKFMTECYRNILMKLPILKDNFSPEFIENLCPLIREKNYAPEDLIFEEGESTNLNLYFVLGGQIDLQVGPKKKTINTLNKEKGFGEYSFFTGLSREYSVKSACLTTLAYITPEDFLYCLNVTYNPKNRETFHLIKEKLRNEISDTSRYCEICKKKTDHLTNYCSRITLKPIIKKETKNIGTPMNKKRNGEKRKPFHRNERKFIPLLNLQELKSASHLINSNDFSDESGARDSEEFFEGESELSIEKEILDRVDLPPQSNRRISLKPKRKNRLYSLSNISEIRKRSFTEPHSNDSMNFRTSREARLNLSIQESFRSITIDKEDTEDKIYEWKYYFPEFNLTRVLEKLEKVRINALVKKSYSKRSPRKRGSRNFRSSRMSSQNSLEKSSGLLKSPAIAQSKFGSSLRLSD